MANPARIPDPRSNDPLDPSSQSRLDPVTGEPRSAANFDEPRIVNRVETRSGGSGLVIAAVVLVLAVVAYFVFAPASNDVGVPAPEPAVTSEPATPAPDASVPAAPADTTAPAPEAVAPAAPADAPAAMPEPTAPDVAAPDATVPAEPAPVQ